MKAAFLKLNRVKVFLLITGLPVIGQIISIILMSIAEVSPQFHFLIFVFHGLISITALMFWLYAVVAEFKDYLPTGQKLRWKRFKLSCLFPTLYFVFLLTFSFFRVDDTGGSNLIASANVLPFFPLIHIAGLFSILYVMYIASACLKAVEANRKVVFIDHFDEFFQFCFHPIGIWLIQPRINKLAKQKEEGTLNQK